MSINTQTILLEVRSVLTPYLAGLFRHLTSNPNQSNKSTLINIVKQFGSRTPSVQLQSLGLLPAEVQENEAIQYIFTTFDLTVSELVDEYLFTIRKNERWYAVFITKLPFFGRWYQEQMLNFVGINGKDCYDLAKSGQITDEELLKTVVLAGLFLAHEEWRASKQ